VSAGNQVEAVVFDYGGVLTGPVRASISAWLRADRIEPASFSRILKAWLSRDAPDGTPIHRLETGALSVAEFSALLAAELTTVDGEAVDPVGILARLFAGLGPDPAMFALVGQLRDLGVRVGLLSNSWGNSYPTEIHALFDPVVISGEVGLRKPLPAIYQLTLDRLGLPADRVLFVDDAEPNVLGARAVGMRALCHTDVERTRKAVAELVPALAEPGVPTNPSETGRTGR
jgi:epoxide hydrolase-like predicted phosphatase